MLITGGNTGACRTPRSLTHCNVEERVGTHLWRRRRPHTPARATAGIGLETAKALCRKGNEVVIACRSPERAAAAIRQLQAAQPSARVSAVQLDLGSQASVKEAAKQLLDTPAFDVVINNAGGWVEVAACSHRHP